jgi:uncharacterized membrane protein
MNWLPDPLHPAIVHFPVVLIVLGALAAVVAVIWRKGYLPHFAAALLAMGAVGAWVAVQTGESDGGLIENSTPQMESLINAHEDWARRTFTAASVAAVAAIASVLLFRFPRASRAVAAATALAALAASYAVYETGHRGGALVFKHGAGVQIVHSSATTEVDHD